MNENMNKTNGNTGNKITAFCVRCGVEHGNNHFPTVAPIYQGEIIEACQGVPCTHEHTAVCTVGSTSFVDGEPFDNVTDTLVCLDCGATLWGDALAEADIPF